jgi:hypothetical protein
MGEASTLCLKIRQIAFPPSNKEFGSGLRSSTSYPPIPKTLAEIQEIWTGVPEGLPFRRHPLGSAVHSPAETQQVWRRATVHPVQLSRPCPVDQRFVACLPVVQRSKETIYPGKPPGATKPGWEVAWPFPISRGHVLTVGFHCAWHETASRRC